jgi:hypothetical protein
MISRQSIQEEAHPKKPKVLVKTILRAEQSPENGDDNDDGDEEYKCEHSSH